jgi:flagellar assembly protein FliH
MPHSKLIPFDRPLADATIPGRSLQPFTESEINAREQKAFQRGVDETRALTDQQMVEQRTEMTELTDGILKTLTQLEPRLFTQFEEQLPELVLEIGRHLLAGYEPPADVVARICLETLEHLYPERENLELRLSPRDTELLTKLDPDWLNRYPGLRIVTDDSLVAGDCKVHSRFGVTDAQLETKLSTLQHHLVPAAS